MLEYKKTTMYRGVENLMTVVMKECQYLYSFWCVDKKRKNNAYIDNQYPEKLLECGYFDYKDFFDKEGTFKSQNRLFKKEKIKEVICSFLDKVGSLKHIQSYTVLVHNKETDVVTMCKIFSGEESIPSRDIQEIERAYGLKVEVVSIGNIFLESDSDYGGFRSVLYIMTISGTTSEFKIAGWENEEEVKKELSRIEETIRRDVLNDCIERKRKVNELWEKIKRVQNSEIIRAILLPTEKNITRIYVKRDGVYCETNFGGDVQQKQLFNFYANGYYPLEDKEEVLVFAVALFCNREGIRPVQLSEGYADWFNSCEREIQRKRNREEFCDIEPEITLPDYVPNPSPQPPQRKRIL